ncbi:MAG: hypothetical protein RR254_00690 [Muribaculaceae bacterium]
MISIIDHIEYLVTKHDCVVIPGLGAFIAQYSCATMNDETGVFKAPERTISFNASVNYNDGLLANSIMRCEKKSYNATLSFIIDEIASYKNQLLRGGEIAIGRLGFFRQSDEGAIIFEPFISATSINEFYGLGRVNISLLSRLEKKHESVTKTRVNDVMYVPISRNVFRIAASIILLIGMTFLLSTPIIVNKNQEFASLNILSSDNKTAENIVDKIGDLYISRPKETVKTIVSNEKEMDAKEIKVVEKTKEEPAKRLQLTSNTATGNESCFLIVASLRTRELAENHIAKANDPLMKVLESDGKYRIYIAAGSREELNSIISQGNIKSVYKGAWICQK